MPDNVDCLVLPGVPGRWDRSEDGSALHPGPTLDVVKLLRTEGLSVEFSEPPESRRELLLKSEEIWLPILAFTTDAVANGAGSLLAHAVIQRFGRKRAEKARLHVRCAAVSGTDQAWFEAEGAGDEVLQALEVWQGEPHP